MMREHDVEIVGPVEMIPEVEKPESPNRWTTQQVLSFLESIGTFDEKFADDFNHVRERQIQNCTDDVKREALRRSFEAAAAANKRLREENKQFFLDTPDNPLIYATRVLATSVETVRVGHYKIIPLPEGAKEAIKSSLFFVPAIVFTAQFRTNDGIEEREVSDLVPPWSVAKSFFLMALDCYLETLCEIARIRRSGYKDKCFLVHLALRKLKPDSLPDEALIPDLFSCLDYAESIHADASKQSGVVRHYNPFSGEQELLSRSLPQDKIEIYKMCDRIFDCFVQSVDMLAALVIDPDAPKVVYHACDPLWLKKAAAHYRGHERAKFIDDIRRREFTGEPRWQEFLPASPVVHVVLHVFKPEFLKTVDLVSRCVMDEWYETERKSILDRLDWFWGRFFDSIDKLLGCNPVCVEFRTALTAVVEHVKMRLQGLPFGLRQDEYGVAYDRVEDGFERLAAAICEFDRNRPDEMPSFESLTCEKRPILSRPKHVALNEYATFVKSARLDSIDFDLVKDSIPDILSVRGAAVAYSQSIHSSLVTILRAEGKVLYQIAVFNDKYILPVGARAYDVEVRCEIPDGGNRRASEIKRIRLAIAKFIRSRIELYENNEECAWIARRWRAVENTFIGQSSSHPDAWQWRAFSDAEAESIIHSMEECAAIDRAPDRVDETSKALENVAANQDRILKLLQGAMSEDGKLLSLVDGYTKQGKREAVAISQTTPEEAGLLRKTALAKLFDVHVNTIGNWLKGEAAPEGFREAYKAKDYNRLMELAVLQRVKTGKMDVMDAKHLVRNISEEQIYKQGGNRV